MFTKVNEAHTYVLAFVALVVIGVIIVKVVDAFNKRGERFHERFLAVKAPDIYESDNPGATPAADVDETYANVETSRRVFPNIDGLGSAVRRDTPAFGEYPRPRPIKDNPQA